jgi:hypothetical protein
VLTFKSLGPGILREDFPNGTYRIHGRDIFMLDTIAKKLNFRSVISYLKPYGGWGSMLMNGTSTGALHTAKIRSTDVSLGSLDMRIERAIHLGYTLPYTSDYIIFVIPPGRPLTPFEKLMSPLNYDVWIALCAVFLIGSLTIGVLEFRSLKKLRNLIIGPGISTPYLNAIMVIFGVSAKKLPFKNFPRFLLMKFLIFSLIVRTLYQGSLFKKLQASLNAKEPETIEEMVQQNFIFHCIFPYYELTSDNAAMKGNRRVISADDVKILMEKSTDSKFQGTILTKISEVLYLNHVRSLANKNIYLICKERYMMIPITMYFPKNSYLSEPFNNVIQYLRASGLMNYWTRINEDNKYLNYDTSTNEPKMLTIEHLLGTFQIWAILCIISVLVFFIEKFKFKFIK